MRGAHTLTVLVELVVLLVVAGVVLRLFAGVRGDRRRLGLVLLPLGLAGCSESAQITVGIAAVWLVFSVWVIVVSFRWHVTPRARVDDTPQLKQLDQLWEAQQISDRLSSPAAHRAVNAATIVELPSFAAYGHIIPPPDACQTALAVPTPTQPDIADVLAQANATTAALQQRLYELADTAVQLATQLHTHFDKNGFGHSQRAVFATLKRLEAIRAEVRPTAPAHETP